MGGYGVAGSTEEREVYQGGAWQIKSFYGGGGEGVGVNSLLFFNSCVKFKQIRK